MGRIGDAVDIATLALLGVGGYLLYKGVKDFKFPEFPAWPSLPGGAIIPPTIPSGNGGGNGGGGVIDNGGGGFWVLKNFGPQGGLSGAALDEDEGTATGLSGSITAGGGGKKRGFKSAAGARADLWKGTKTIVPLGGSIMLDPPAAPVIIKPVSAIGISGGILGLDQRERQALSTGNVPKNYRDGGNRVY